MSSRSAILTFLAFSVGCWSVGPAAASSPAAVDHTAGLSWTKHVAAGPHGFVRTNAVYDTELGKIVLYAWVEGAGQTWTWDGTTWTKLEIDSPGGFFDTSLAYDEANGNVVLFGGEPSDGVQTDQTWIFDGDQWQQLNPARSPSPRESAALAYDPVLGQVLLFGGFGAGSYRRDTWAFDGTTWTKLRSATRAPLARRDGHLTYDPIRGQLVLVGGWGFDGRPAEGCERGERCFPKRTWSWDGTDWAVVDLDRVPPVRAAAGVTTVGDRVVMFGGDGGDRDYDPLHDTWVLGATAWHRVLVHRHKRPPGRFLPSFAYDAGRQEAVMFGGFINAGGGGLLADTWTLARR